MSMMKNSDLEEREADDFALGAGPDGKVKMLTLEEAARLIGQRDADEEAFADVIDPDDLSDLDDDDSEVLAAVKAAR